MISSLKTKYSKSPLKVDIYNLRSIKANLDDVILEYITKVLNKKLKTWYMDFEIFVGIISTIVSVITVYLSCNYEFEDYKTYLIICLGIYFFFNGIIYICDWLRPKIYNFDNMSVCTEMNPPSPIYTILVYKNEKCIPEKWSKCIFDLFDEEGRLYSEEFLDEMDKFFNK